MLANILIYGLLAILASRLAFAIPNTLTLQGKLTNAAGGVLSGSYTMVFRIYDIPGFSYYNVSNQTGEDNTAIQNITYINYTNILWEDNRTVTTDANGIYDVVLHNLSLLNFSEQYYLGIMIGDDNESIPRINLTSSPYAFRANISEGLNKENKYEVSVLNITGNLTLGESFDDALTVTTGRLNISDGSIKAAGNLTLAEKITFSLGQIIDNLVNGFLRISGNLNVTGNASIAQDTLFVDNTSRRVGIGTTGPYNELTVIGSVGVSGTLNASSINITGNAYFATASGKVGIGTTSPNDILEVIGNVRVSGSLNATNINASRLYARNGTAAAPAYTFIEDTNTGIMKTSEDNLTLVTGGASRLIIDSSGNVGIGTTTPNYKLDVTGTINASGLHIDGNANITGRLDVGTLNISGVTFSQGDLDVAKSLRVAGGANISGDLGVLGNIYGEIPDAYKKANYSAEYSSTGFDNENFTVRYDLRTDRFAIANVTAYLGDDGNASLLRTGNISNILLNAFKNENFTVRYDLRTDRFALANVTAYLGDDGNASLLRTSNISNILLNAFKNENFTVRYDLRTDRFARENVTDYLGGADINASLLKAGNISNILLNAFKNENLTGKAVNFTYANVSKDLVVLGNVGIGTTAPLSLLHLNKSDLLNTSVTNVLTLDHTNPNGVNLTGGIGVSMLFRASDNASQIYNIGNISAILYNSTNGSQLGAITFSTVGADVGDGSFGHLTERLRIDGYGRVGINTTTPTKTLHVIGDANITGRLDVGTLNITGVTFSQGDLDIAKSLRVAGGANISGDLGVLGKIGAGTLTPITTLDVKGKANFTGNFSIMNASDTLFFVDNTSGRVGIGTTTPSSDLHIFTSNNINSGSNFANRIGGLLIKHSSGDSGLLFDANQIEQIDSASDLFINVNSPSKTLINFGGGSVGIGTTTPTDKLQVMGNFSVRNQSDASKVFLFVSNATGNAGIGNTIPNASLDVTGNIFLSSASPIINVSGPTIRKSGNDIVISD